MCRDPREADLLELETNAYRVVGNDWQSRLDKMLLDNLGKFRKYDGKSVQDLMRALRNKVRISSQYPSHHLYLLNRLRRKTTTKIYLTMPNDISALYQTDSCNTSLVVFPVCSYTCTRSSRGLICAMNLCSNPISSFPSDLHISSIIFSSHAFSAAAPVTTYC